MNKAFVRLKEIQGRKGQGYQTASDARQAGESVLAEEEVTRWLRVRIEEKESEVFKQDGPGRPGPATTYIRVVTKHYHVHYDEDKERLARDARCDGLFPLMTNDTGLTVQDALLKYKYQPFVEKRHAQLKSGFNVVPMWLKDVGRVASMLWLFYVVELIAALVERQVRKEMVGQKHEALPLYPEGRASEAPTASVIFDVLEGHRRHRLLTADERELARFYDPVSPVAQTVLELLGIELGAYGLN